MIVDEQKAWLVNYLSSDFENNIQVTKVFNNKKKSKDNGWTLLTLLGSQGIKKGFAPTQTGEVGGKIFYQLKPLQNVNDLKKARELGYNGYEISRGFRLPATNLDNLGYKNSNFKSEP
mgnify:CR=1 FL=1